VIALWSLLSTRDFARAAGLIGGAALTALAAIASLTYATGGVGVAPAILSMAAKANTSNPYTLTYQAGSGDLFLSAFDALSPLTSVLAALGIFMIVVKNRHAKCGMALLAWLTIGFLAVFMLVPLWLNLRYATPAYAPLSLFAGIAAWQLLSAVRRKLPGDA